MTKASLSLLMASVMLSGADALCAAANEMKPRDLRSTNLPRPRDPDIAVQEELDAARRSATVEAYDLFLARHGDHPLAESARRERQALIDAPAR